MVTVMNKENNDSSRKNQNENAGNDVNAAQRKQAGSDIPMQHRKDGRFAARKVHL